MDKDLKKQILLSQKNEITEHLVYKRLSLIVKAPEHKAILKRISDEELGHYDFFKSLTQEEVPPDKVKLFFYVFISRALGLNFGLKLMESGEDLAQKTYDKLKQIDSKIDNLLKDEQAHEVNIINMIDEERLKYASSIVLGLNDALVELTGALAGFTLALQNTKLIAIVGLITGIAASMSMAASEYLSTKHDEGDGKNPFKASIYTGLAYVGTVIFLIFPYFIFENIFLSLANALINALLIIITFTFYISIAKGLNFKKKFLEMAGLSLSIAAINFFIGLAIRNIFGIDV